MWESGRISFLDVTYFNNNILLNPILLNACKAANGTAVKNTHEYINYLWHIFTHETSKY